MTDSDESSVLILPDDEARKQQLRNKLEEYKKRQDKYKHPALQMNTTCKITVLERLLQDGRVNTYELSLEMAEVYGTTFDIDSFDNACGVIDDYCKTGGTNAQGGTGLKG